MFDGGLRATWRGLRHLQRDGYVYIWSNLAFVALSLPLLTAPAATSALFRIGYLAHTQPNEATLSAFWETFRANLLRALPWGILNLIFVAINSYNLLTYWAVEGAGAAILRTVWIVAAFFWLSLLLYTWPIYYEMAEPSIAGAVRNALVMTLRNPLFTFSIVAAVLLLSMVSTILVAAWLLLTFGAVSSIANAAVLDRLARLRAGDGPSP